MKRYALLDTDFISKTHSVQDDNGNHLIDRVMELPEYEFFCHAQIVTELNRYKTDIDLVDPAATRSSMAAEMVRDVPLLLFSMDILSAGQCAVRNGSAFIPDEAVAGDGSTSNADRRICDFYDSAGGWQRGCVFGTGGSNDSASMVHIRKGET